MGQLGNGSCWGVLSWQCVNLGYVVGEEHQQRQGQMLSGFMYKKIMLILIVIASACKPSITEVTDYEMYHDKDKKLIKAKGRLINNDEEGEWYYFSENGDTIKYGTFLNGLNTGRWYYNMDGIDKEIVWEQIDIDKCNFSLPQNFILKDSGSNVSDKLYFDTVSRTVLKISIVDSCDSNCLTGYYDLTLNNIKDDKQVLFSKSTIVNSQSSKIYYDDFILRKGTSDSIRQLMLYKSIDSHKVVFISVVNWNRYYNYLKFISSEIFYHFKYDYYRIAYATDELTVYEIK